jgi:2-dehydropantoate 2-reductase
MRIAILGSGAMGCLFAGLLSRCNQVSLIARSEQAVKAINEKGLRIREQDGTIFQASVPAYMSGTELGPMDLVVVFVKSMDSISALKANEGLIGKSTFLMTLQNGSGHDEELARFVSRDRIVLGVTRHNSSVIEPGLVSHGGSGQTVIGLLGFDPSTIRPIEQAFTACALDCIIALDIERQIWSKLLLNTSVSSLTALLQVKQGFIIDDPYACSVMETLASEAVEVGNAYGYGLDRDKSIESIKALISKAKGGLTSIYADIRDGRLTEVDYISGSVIRAAQKKGIEVPCHRMLVALIHAMEDKGRA